MIKELAIYLDMYHDLDVDKVFCQMTVTKSLNGCDCNCWTSCPENLFTSN